MILALLLTMMFAPAIQSRDAADTATLVRVYAHTDDAGDVPARDARRESLKDLQAALTDKKKDLVLVKTDDEADVLIEVVDRTTTIPKVAFGPVVSSGQPSRGPGLASPVRAVHLRVSLTYRGDPIIFTNKAALTESPAGWRSAADDIAKQVAKWIVDHRAEILAKRNGS
jgi:deoxyribodipyrimidine photolyase